MASYVYLIQNGDLFNIGFTDNLERTRINLRPGELVAFLNTDNPEPLIKNIRKLVHHEITEKLESQVVFLVRIPEEFLKNS